MANYVVNFRINGYEGADIADDKLKGDNNEIIIVTDGKSNDKLREYYMTIFNILKGHNRLFLINIEDSCEIFKPLAILMASYRNYNIYQVASPEVINGNYIRSMLGREPSYSEVQTFVGGDITAYNDISILMLGIESLVEEGNMDGITTFFENHVSSIEKLTSSLDYMKTICSLYNTDELGNKIEALEKKLEMRVKELEMMSEKASMLEEQKKASTTAQEKMKKEIENLKAKASNSDGPGGSVIRMYPELNTATIRCRIERIVYFKEISYVPYVNTMVRYLTDYWNNCGKKTKLMVYDNRTEFYQVYGKKIACVRGSDYDRMKGTVLKNDCVIAEPAPNIISEVLEQTDYKVLILYDRMHCKNDVVIGNNVSKFYVINSNTDYKAMMSVLKILDESFIITRSDSEFSEDAIKLKPIADFKNASMSAKTVKYFKLTGPDGVRIFDKIAFKSRIEIEEAN